MHISLLHIVFLVGNNSLFTVFFQYIPLFSVLTTSPASGTSCYRWKLKIPPKLVQTSVNIHIVTRESKVTWTYPMRDALSLQIMLHWKLLFFQQQIFNNATRKRETKYIYFCGYIKRWLSQFLFFCIFWIGLPAKPCSFSSISLNYRSAASAQTGSFWTAAAAALDANHPLWREGKKKKAAQSFGESGPKRANLPFFTEKKSSLTVHGHMSVLFCACTGDAAVVIHAWLIECGKPPQVTFFHSNKRAYSIAYHCLSLINYNF